MNGHIVAEAPSSSALEAAVAAAVPPQAVVDESHRSSDSIRGGAEELPVVVPDDFWPSALADTSVSPRSGTSVGKEDDPPVRWTPSRVACCSWRWAVSYAPLGRRSADTAPHDGGIGCGGGCDVDATFFQTQTLVFESEFLTWSARMASTPPLSPLLLVGLLACLAMLLAAWAMLRHRFHAYFSALRTLDRY